LRQERGDLFAKGTHFTVAPRHTFGGFGKRLKFLSFLCVYVCECGVCRSMCVSVCVVCRVWGVVCVCVHERCVWNRTSSTQTENTRSCTRVRSDEDGELGAYTLSLSLFVSLFFFLLLFFSLVSFFLFLLLFFLLFLRSFFLDRFSISLRKNVSMDDDRGKVTELSNPIDWTNT